MIQYPDWYEVGDKVVIIDGSGNTKLPVGNEYTVLEYDNHGGVRYESGARAQYLKLHPTHGGVFSFRVRRAGKVAKVKKGFGAFIEKHSL